MPSRKRNYRVFLESEEYGFEDFKADSFREAMEKIERLFVDASSAFFGDGITRKVGIIIE